MFSVIIPLYNKANFIKATVASVLNQYCQSFELIIVDDGSTDESMEVVSKFHDERVVVYSKVNGGVSSARNFGIEKATHDFIVFLDADDLWDVDYLSTLKEIIEDRPYNEIFAVAYRIVTESGVQISGNEIEAIKNKKQFVVEDYSKSLMTKEMFLIWTGAICVRRELFSRVGSFPVNIKRGEDLDTWLRLSLVSQIVVINEPKATYNLLTENNSIDSYKTFTDSFPYWKWYNYSDSKYVKSYATSMIYLLMKLSLQKKKYQEVWILFFKCRGRYKLLHRFYALFRALIRK